MAMTASPSPPLDHGRRPSTTLAAFLIGLPLAAAILGGIHRFLPHDHIAVRYVHHPVENVEVGLFCCAMGALLAKLWQTLAERRACRSVSLPAWDGKPVAVSEASRLLSSLGKLPRRLHSTWLSLRVRAVLDFLRQRGSANDLDDQMRALADNDAMGMENSYALTRFITWAIPILGFLGTVLGITQSIAGITPEVLEKSLSSVTDGLALSFDATALALGLTMIAMFCTFLVERAEQGILDNVDRYVETHLAHRFARYGSGENGAMLEALEVHTKTVLTTAETMVRRQADVWAEAMAGTEKRAAERLAGELDAALERTLRGHTAQLAEMDKRSAERLAEMDKRSTKLTGELNAALERALQGHTARLAEMEKRSAERQAEMEKRPADRQAEMEKHSAARLAEMEKRSAELLMEMEKRSAEQGRHLVEQIGILAASVRDTARDQQQALARVAEGVIGQATVLSQLQHNEKQLVQMQATLHQNLNALTAAGAFEQAVHSLTAAIHLLTNRATPPAAPTVLRMHAAEVRPNPGKVA
jgi:biopolymer transport protein ExbB/TolQ